MNVNDEHIAKRSSWHRESGLGLLFVWCLFGTLHGQVDVDQSLTIAEYVNDVLLGEGVSATNINFIGSPEQIGYMTGGNDVGFPVAGGLVLSSGNAADAFCAGLGCATCSGPTPTGNDLLEVANSVPP